jgi:hypothetical protein
MEGERCHSLDVQSGAFVSFFTLAAIDGTITSSFGEP